MMTRPGPLVVGAAVVLLCLIWGTTWAVIQIGLEGIPPFTGVAARFALSAALLLLLAWLLGVKFGTSRRERLLWLVNGLLSFTVSYGVVYWAEQWVPSGLASILFATYPLFVVLIGRVVLPEERLSRLEVVGVLAGFAGVIVIFGEDFGALGGEQVALASAVMLLSPLAAAAGSVWVKRYGQGIHPFSVTAVPMALTAVVLGVVALVTERDRTFVFDAVSVGALLYLAVLGSAVTFTLYYWLLSHLPAKRLALIAYVIPLVAVAIGVLRGEPLTSRVLLGAGLVLGGVALSVHRPPEPTTTT